MTFKLDLTKSARTIQLDLSKRGVPSTVKAEGIINLDISDSFYHEYVEGTVDILVARLVPYGMVLDPDGKIDVFAYSDGESNAHYIGTVTPAEAENFVRRQIFGKVAGWRGGTSYSYVFEKNLQHFGWLPTDPDQAPAQRPRFWDRVASALFGDDSAPAQPVVQDEVTEQKRSIVFHVSDGEINHDDYNRAMRLLEDSERRGDNVFFQMIGACEHGVDFRFMKDASARFDNVDFVEVRDPEEFVEQTDDEMNARLLSRKVVDWLKQ